MNKNFSKMMNQIIRLLKEIYYQAMNFQVEKEIHQAHIKEQILDQGY